MSEDFETMDSTSNDKFDLGKAPETVTTETDLGKAPENTRNTYDKNSAKEKSICRPTPFDGDRKKIENFVQECRMYLQINKGIYTTDEDKIIFMLSYMNEKEALRWKQTYLRSITNNEGDLEFPTIRTFVDLLASYFQPANLAQDAIHKLNMLKQGKKNAEEVVTEFRLLCSQAGFSSETTTDHLHLIERLQRVLNASLIKKIMLLEKPPTTIDGWVDKAIFFDTMYRNTMEVLAQKIDEGRTTNRNKGGTSRRFEYSNYFGNRDNRSWREPREKKDPDAMDIDAMSTEKRTLLMKKGLCFICEKSGHRASEHKDFETKRKDKDDVPKRKDIRKLHTYLQKLSKEETAELLALQTGDKEENKDEEDSDF